MYAREHTADSFGSFSMNISREAKNRIFSDGGIGDFAKNDKILKSSVFTRFCPRDLAMSKNSLGIDFCAQT